MLLYAMLNAVDDRQMPLDMSINYFFAGIDKNNIPPAPKKLQLILKKFKKAGSEVTEKGAAVHFGDKSLQ